MERGENIVVLIFTAGWCQPCTPYVPEAACLFNWSPEFAGECECTVIQLDARDAASSQNLRLASAMGVHNVPTVVFCTKIEGELREVPGTRVVGACDTDSLKRVYALAKAGASVMRRKREG